MKISGAVVVLFHPHPLEVLKLVENLVESCNHVVLVDNTPVPTLSANLFDSYQGLSYLALRYNAGIAEAQNRGILHLKSLGVSFVFLFDQDSTLPADFVTTMLKEFDEVSRLATRPVACLSPKVINQRNSQGYPQFYKDAHWISEHHAMVPTTIASGMLIPMDVLSKIGLMKSEWFIDSIDTEWCYRARFLGYVVIITNTCTLTHQIGSRDLRLPLLGRALTIGAPIRLYYVYRNWVLSLGEPVFPLGYKLRIVLGMFIKFFFFIWVKPGGQRFMYMVRGIIDGLKGLRYS